MAVKSFPLDLGVHDLGEAQLVSVTRRNSATSWARFEGFSSGVVVFTDRFEEAFGVKVEEQKRGFPQMVGPITGRLEIEVKQNDYGTLPLAWLKSFDKYNGDPRTRGSRGSGSTGFQVKGNPESNVISRVLAACIESGMPPEKAEAWVDLGLRKLREVSK